MKKVRSSNKFWKLSHIFILFLLIAIMTGCSDKTSIATVSDPKIQFLTIFFTSDYNQRYTTYLKNSNNNPQKTLDYYNSYMDEFRDLTTEKCLDNMTADRDPIKYDQIAYESGYTVTVNNMQLKKKDKDSDWYTYEISVTETKGKTDTPYEYTGEIRIDPNGKISDIRYLSSAAE